MTCTLVEVDWWLARLSVWRWDPDIVASEYFVWLASREKRAPDVIAMLSSSK
jgi:hypothetical protein